jgi:hypothetical protein
MGPQLWPVSENLLLPDDLRRFAALVARRSIRPSEVFCAAAISGNAMAKEQPPHIAVA